ncbi:MAG: LOG family protein [Woeseia sp.]
MTLTGRDDSLESAGEADDPQLRGVRLQTDYLETELRLRAAGVQQTIVVFGGTRIIEESAARQLVEKRRLACGKKPDDVRRKEQLAIAESLLAKSHFYTIAREFGAIVGKAGGGPADCSLTLVTGGGPGIMEAASRGSCEVGAKNIGLNITLPNEQHPNRYLTRELSFTLRYFAIRKLHFLLRARALVVFPGGYGTLDELFETLNLVATGTIDALPIVLVGESYWRRLVDLDLLVLEGVIEPSHRELCCFAESAQQTWQIIKDWHERAGIALHCPV